MRGTDLPQHLTTRRRAIRQARTAQVAKRALIGGTVALVVLGMLAWGLR
jgi:hypothetical protein